MIFENAQELRERVAELTGRPVRRPIEITDDTSNYFGISAGTVLRLGGSDYLVTGEAMEGRFGISEQPKYWVKYAYDLTTGARKIIKLVFHESFNTSMGMFTFRLTRNPDKESAVLAATAGDPRFMQGFTVRDANGRNVRIIEFIRGKSIYNYVANIDEKHEEYYHGTMLKILAGVADCLDALALLHEQGLQHGDVRNDHIFIETDSGDFRWIDFDYEVNYGDYDVWCVGNVLTYVVAKGLQTVRDARFARPGDDFSSHDGLLFFKHRLANLRKLYPYVDAELNDMLMRFSLGTIDFFEDVPSIVVDLRRFLART
jgi:hypothetical protein